MKPPARRLRRYFFTGLIVLAPVGVTAVVLSWMFRTIDNILGKPLQAALGMPLPGVGFVLLIAAVLLVGWVVHFAAGRQLLHWWNEAMARFPVTGRLYNAMSQIVQAVVGEQRRLFHRTVLIPYPTDGLWAIAFVTSERAPILADAVGEPCVNVFVPTTPNPTSGFMLVVPTSRVRPLEISVEEAMKLIMSGGAVTPGDVAAVRRRGLDLDSLLKGPGG